MLTTAPFRLRASMRAFAALSVFAALCGCSTMRFEAKREARFINMDADVLHVSYGEEKRTETLPNGLVCTFKEKVLLRLPDGKRVVLYQALATSGMLYRSKDKTYEFREKGPYSILSHNGRMIFEGVYCRK